MEAAELFFLQNKSYEPIINTIESHSRNQALKESIAIYLNNPLEYLIITNRVILNEIVERNGGVELLKNALRVHLYREPERFKLLYGNPDLVTMIDPSI